MKQQIDKILLYGFAVLPASFFFPIPTFSYCIIILLALTLAKCYIKPVRFKQFFNNKLLLFCVGYFFLHCFALLYTKNTTEGLQGVVKILSFALIPFIGYVAFYSNEKTTQPAFETTSQLISKSFVIVGVLSIIICLSYAIYAVNFGNGSKKWWFFYRGLASTIKIHPSFFAYYLNFQLVLLLFYNWEIKAKSLVFVKFFFVALTLVFLILLSTRVPLVVTTLILFYFVFVRIKSKILVITILSTLLALIGICLFNVDTRVSDFIDSETFWSLPRFETWKGAIQVFKQNVLVGVPPGDLNDALMNQFKLNGFTEGVNFEYNCHNQYLQQLCSFGILGIVFFIVWMFYVVKKVISLNRVFTLLVFSILIYFVSETLLSVNKGIIFVSYFFTLIALHERKFG